MGYGPIRLLPTDVWGALHKGRPFTTSLLTAPPTGWTDGSTGRTERMLHGIGGISAPCHAMPLLLANIPFHVNYLVE
jgi:hypothetical protein